MSGSNTIFARGVYKTQGVADAASVPQARRFPASWTDSSGNFWLFGGLGWNSVEAGFLNDLWEYSPATNMWTWVGGSNAFNASDGYGTQGITASTNLPGGRAGSTSWTDSSGNFWLFGGEGPTSADENALWKYSPSSNEWTWMSGSNTPGAAGVYGAQGTSSSSTMPGARGAASGWVDSEGNLWLFGGGGGVADWNDLWRYHP